MGEIEDKGKAHFGWGNFINRILIGIFDSMVFGLGFFNVLINTKNASSACGGATQRTQRIAFNQKYFYSWFYTLRPLRSSAAGGACVLCVP